MQSAILAVCGHGCPPPSTWNENCSPRILDPETLAHRFYRRDGELLVEYAAQENRIASQVVAGFFVLREWLDPKQIPSIAGSLAQIVG